MRTGWDLIPAARSDRVTWTYPVIEPWHIAFTTSIAAVDIEVDGEFVLRNGAPTRVDAAEIRAKAAEASRRLFARLQEL